MEKLVAWKSIMDKTKPKDTSIMEHIYWVIACIESAYAFAPDWYKVILDADLRKWKWIEYCANTGDYSRKASSF